MAKKQKTTPDARVLAIGDAIDLVFDGAPREAAGEVIDEVQKYLQGKGVAATRDELIALAVAHFQKDFDFAALIEGAPRAATKITVGKAAQRKSPRRSPTRR